MKKYLLRWPTWLLLAAIIVAALIPGLSVFHVSKSSRAHAAGTNTSPIISFSASIVRPYQTVNVTGQGFAPGDSVQLHLDNANNYVFGTFYCDSNGNCSGTVQMPYGGMVQGVHSIIGTATSGLVAETSVTFVPRTIILALNFQLSKSGPGTPIQLYGDAFNANEPVRIFWGGAAGIPEGSATTDASGHLSFNLTVPTGIAPGNYAVTVVRSGQKPAKVSSWFRILSPAMISIPPGIRGSQTVFLSVSGFQANEQVGVSWSANGGQQVTIFTTNDFGDGGSQFIPASAPRGSYTLTAIGNSSGLKATSSLNVGPGIALKPYGYELPGGFMEVIGGGFTPGETVNVHVQYHTKSIHSATVDASGAFSVGFTLPTSYNQASNYFYVYAVSSTGTDEAKASFSFVPAGLQPDACCITYGSPITFIGQGFKPNEAIDLFWNYQHTGQLKVGSVKAASDGTFSITLSTPSDPNSFNVSVAAIGTESKLKAITGIVEYAALLLSPPSGGAGTRLHISGGGFNSTETVSLSFNGTTLPTVTTDVSGGFSFTYVVPANKGAGNASVQATGSSSGISVEAIFGYKPDLKISPSTGPSGTIVTVTGHHFSARWEIAINWVDPSTGSQSYLGAFPTTSEGYFTGNVTIPAGLLGGNTYYIQAFDGQTLLRTQVPFIAQAACAQCIQLTPNTAIPGATISVQGSNFTAGETVNIYFQQASNGIVSATVDGSGIFTAALTVPMTYQKGVPYYVYAVSTTGTDHASAQFLYAQPWIGPTNPYDGFAYNTPAEFIGGGFAAGEAVNFYWTSQQIGERKAGTATTDSQGNFDTTLIIPSIPFNQQINLVAVGTISKVRASTPLTESAGLIDTPSSGNPGAKVQVNGGGFASGEIVTLTFEGNTIGTLITDKWGGFTTSYTIPSSTQLGAYLIEAVGSSSGVSVSTDFVVVPTVVITPTTGTSGTSITVKGSFFNASSTLTILWFDPNAYTDTLLGTVTTSASGDFKTVVTAPTNLTSGDTYYVQIFDPLQNVVIAIETFTAQ